MERIPHLLDAYDRLAAACVAYATVAAPHAHSSWNGMVEILWTYPHRLQGRWIHHPILLDRPSAHTQLACKAAEQAMIETMAAFSSSLEAFPCLTGVAQTSWQYDHEKQTLSCALHNISMGKPGKVQAQRPTSTAPLSIQCPLRGRWAALAQVLDALPHHQGRRFKVDTWILPAGDVDSAIVLWQAIKSGGTPKATDLAAPKGARGEPLALAEMLDWSDTRAAHLAGWAARLGWS